MQWLKPNTRGRTNKTTELDESDGGEGSEIVSAPEVCFFLALFHNQFLLEFLIYIYFFLAVSYLYFVSQWSSFVLLNCHDYLFRQLQTMETFSSRILVRPWVLSWNGFLEKTANMAVDQRPTAVVLMSFWSSLRWIVIKALIGISQGRCGVGWACNRIVPEIGKRISLHFPSSGNRTLVVGPWGGTPSRSRRAAGPHAVPHIEQNV